MNDDLAEKEIRKPKQSPEQVSIQPLADGKMKSPDLPSIEIQPLLSQAAPVVQQVQTTKMPGLVSKLEKNQIRENSAVQQEMKSLLPEKSESSGLKVIGWFLIILGLLILLFASILVGILMMLLGLLFVIVGKSD